MKYIITESQYNNAIDKFISYQFEPHEEKKYLKYPNSIFWVKNDEVFAEIQNSKYFCIKMKVWDIISFMFSLEYEEVQSLIKNWLEEHYKMGELTPMMIRGDIVTRWTNITKWDD